MPSGVRPFAAIARRDAEILFSYRSTALTRPVGVVFNLALFYFVSRLVNVTRFQSPDAYFAFVAVGIVIYGFIRSALEVPLSLREEFVAGTYERLELSPAGGTVAIAGMLITPFVYTLALSAFTLVVSALVFGVDVQWGTAPLGVPLALLGTLAFAPLALVLCAVTLAFKQVPGQGVVLPSLALISGLYFPVSLLPNWLQWASEVQPLTPTVDLMRHVLLGSPSTDPAAGEVLRLVAFAAIGIPIAVYVVSAARSFSRARGTLLES